MNNLTEYAKKYNHFGFNVVPLIITKNGKKPLGKWGDLIASRQSADDIEKLNWKDPVNGIGGINHTITSIDFDKCSDENFILSIANELGINSWIVKTGFGYHFHMLLDDDSDHHSTFGSKSVIVFDPKDKSRLSQCELRIRNCFTALPPSQHYNGNAYTFIAGWPQNPPPKVFSKNLIAVLSKYFTIKFDQNDLQNASGRDEFVQAIQTGTIKGRRHDILVRYFGLLNKKEFSKDLIVALIKNWNKQNKPPLSDSEILRTVDDLWVRYRNNLNGKFHQFENVLLALRDKVEKKLKMILCYSVIEYESDEIILNDLGLDSLKEQYHKECKEFINKNFERTKKKDQIIRVGENLIIDVINGNFKYEYFSVYAGIISFLGRKYAAKQISNEIIGCRAIGYKNFKDWFGSGRIQQPLSRYKITKAIDYLEDAGFLHSFSLKRGRMKFYSTQLKTKEELAEFVKNCERKKLRRKIEEEKLRKHINNDLQGLEGEYEQLKRNNSPKMLNNHF